MNATTLECCFLKERRRWTSNIDSVCCREVYYFFADLAATADRKVSMERAQGIREMMEE